jgi:hypothetical protein
VDAVGRIYVVPSIRVHGLRGWHFTAAQRHWPETKRRRNRWL